MSNTTVFEYLKSVVKDETIYYKPNPGNGGDSLIASGAFLVFKKLGLNVEFINSNDFDATGKIVLYAGGGNLVGIYHDASDFIKKYHEKAKRLILLPHTVKENEELLKSLGENVTLFARENITYQYLKDVAKNCNVFLDDDMAFNIKPELFKPKNYPSLTSQILKKIFYKLFNQQDKLSNLPSFNKLIKVYWFELQLIFKKHKSGNFFREDIEKLSTGLPQGNVDLSKLYEFGTETSLLCDSTTARLLNVINKFDEIHTDRLHICVSGALLGKKVFFHPNSYFKCKAVYEYSLKGKYNNVTFIEK